MRKLCLALLVSAAVWAQQPAPPAPPAAQTPPDKVVAKVEGKPYTAAEIQKLLDEFPPPIRMSFAKKPKETLASVFLIRYLANQARLHHLDEADGFKQNDAWARLQALSQAQLSYYHDSYRPPAADERAYYEKHPEKWQQAKFQEIVIRFAPNVHSPIKRTEADAKALADDLRKQIEGGADFGALAKEHSDDKVSGPKNGEHVVIERGSAYPEELKKLLFGMKAGDVSQPVKQFNSYYLLKLNELTSQSFNDVESRIFRDLQQERFSQYVQGVEQQNQVTVVDAKFFANSDKN